MIGLLAKSLREVGVSTALYALALVVVERVLTFVLPQFSQELADVWLQMEFMRMFVAGLLGIDPDDGIAISALHGLMWVHPVVLALIWAHETMLCTRFPAGEIDRGTIDLLLSMPVTRRTVYLAETISWLVTGAVIIGLGALGYFAGTLGLPAEERPPTAHVLAVLGNLYCLYVAVGGMAFLASSVFDRRGRAVACVLGIVLGSFLLNFVAQMWEPAQDLAFLGILDYYRPAAVLRDGTVPALDVFVLLGLGVVTWGAGGEITARRSMCTV